jgi:tripartite-type tricarboxylate transporter receptor subunit TctC
MKAPEVQKRLIELAVEPDGGPPEKLAAYQRSELVKWAKVVKEQGVKPD